MIGMIGFQTELNQLHIILQFEDLQHKLIVSVEKHS